MPPQSSDTYHARLAAETDIYRDCLEVHDLPAIFHYWSNKYARQRLEEFGFNSPDAMFRTYAAAQCQLRPDGLKRFASIGSGNCDLETDLAAHLRASGYSEFQIDCLDLNPDMLERGRARAESLGVAAQLNFVQADFNHWQAAHEYDLVLANQSLHHVLDLEGVFAEIARSLKPTGRFVMSDMIGRNGHQRWPEALAIVHEIWRKLPPSYRYNRRFHRYEEMFEDYDCSGESFEGIRAQDILPLLIDRFRFEMFIGFGNVIDPFVDRTFGFNFDPAAPWDRGFIDEVNRRDEEEILSGRIKPTHIVAAVGNVDLGVLRCRKPLTPEFCFRETSRLVVGCDALQPAYEWGAWPHNPQDELEIACRWLKEASDRLKEQTTEVAERSTWALGLQQELDEVNQTLDERTAWAQRLDQDLTEGNATIVELNRKVEELHAELEDRTAWALRLEQELAVVNKAFEERTAWALQLDREVQEHRARAQHNPDNSDWPAWAQTLDRGLHRVLSKGLRLFKRP